MFGLLVTIGFVISLCLVVVGFIKQREIDIQQQRETLEKLKAAKEQEMTELARRAFSGERQK